MGRFVLLIALFLAAWSGTPTEASLEKHQLKEVEDTKYKPGQVWSYKTRPGEDTSTLTILRVDEISGGQRIVHIRVDGIRLKNCTGGREPDTVQHMPFAKEFIDASVTEVFWKVPVPSFADGYAQWRKGWEAGKAGYYTIPVSEAVQVMQKTFSSELGCPQ
jgi:hypothetical protein